TNPVFTSAVTYDPNITLATGNSGSAAAPVPYSGRTFYLYNNAVLLATSVASASCASGTTWNGSTCQAPTTMSVTLTPAFPSSTIPSGTGISLLDVLPISTNPVFTSAVTYDPNITLATGNSGSAAAPVP